MSGLSREVRKRYDSCAERHVYVHPKPLLDALDAAEHEAKRLGIALDATVQRAEKAEALIPDATEWERRVQEQYEARRKAEAEAERLRGYEQDYYEAEVRASRNLADAERLAEALRRIRDERIATTASTEPKPEDWRPMSGESAAQLAAEALAQHEGKA